VERLLPPELKESAWIFCGACDRGEEGQRSCVLNATKPIRGVSSEPHSDSCSRARCIERGQWTVVRCDGETFSVDETWLPRKAKQRSGRQVSRAGVLADDNKNSPSANEKAIETALPGGRVLGPHGAAAKLAIPHQTLASKIASLGIDKRRLRVHPSKQASAQDLVSALPHSTQGLRPSSLLSRFCGRTDQCPCIFLNRQDF
jgi:hypothetical protein